MGVASKGYYVSVSQWEWNRASMEESGMEKRIRTQGGIMQEQDCEVEMKESWKVCEGLQGWLRKRWWWWWWWWWWSCDSTFNIWLEKGVLGKTRNRPSFSLPPPPPGKLVSGTPRLFLPWFLPGTPKNNFLMDVWWTNHFLRNDWESTNWNNHKKTWLFGVPGSTIKIFGDLCWVCFLLRLARHLAPLCIWWPLACHNWGNLREATMPPKNKWSLWEIDFSKF